MTWFIVIALVSVFAVLGLVGYGTFYLYKYLTVSDAQNASVGIGRALLERERELFVANVNGTPQIQIDAANFPVLDERMRKYLIPFNMFKIKVFGADKKIVYSTDKSILNMVDDKNAKLARTLAKGEVIPAIALKGSVKDLGGAERFNVDVVETYLPIRDENNFIIGAFEVYTDVSAYRKGMVPVLALTLTVAFAVMVLIVVGLFIPMRKGVFQLLDIQESLERFGAVRGGAKA
ncbi:MAG: hypothetical protein HYU77_15845 [Betaproteobacteria bacterium]|nr:hypothetical protein [Betaproteobacteria bacterium]